MTQSISHDKDNTAMQVSETTSQGYATQTAARVAVVCALLLGIAADRLLWNEPMGAGWVLWIALFGTAAVLVVRQAHFAWQRETVIAAAIAVGAAAIPALRASEALVPISMLAIVTAASIPLLRARSLRFAATPLAAQLLGIAAVGAHAAGGAVPLIASDVGRATLPSRTMRVPLIAARGVLLALPPLVIFGALFISADPLFERYSHNILRFVSEDLLSHILFTLAFCWITAGLLRSLLPRRSVIDALPNVPAVSAPEVTIALGAVAALFLAFVLVQARWFFGGAAALQASTGLTVAEYARRGFFELVVAAALVLPLLLAADAATRTASKPARFVMRTLSGAIIALVFVVMTSAMQRMALYTQRFGLTEQRLYTTAFMGWLAVVFAWYVITTLRGRRRRFAAGPVAAGIASVFTLAALNPDALIARVNFERAHHGATVDSAYLTQLSADAAPQLLAHLDELPGKERCRLAQHLLKQSSKPATDWRSANRARAEASALVSANAARLKQAANCPVTVAAVVH